MNYWIESCISCVLFKSTGRHTTFDSKVLPLDIIGYFDNMLKNSISVTSVSMSWSS